MNLYTKFEVSILNGCKDIFDEKSGEKEKRTNTGKNKYRALSRSFGKGPFLQKLGKKQAIWEKKLQE